MPDVLAPEAGTAELGEQTMTTTTAETSWDAEPEFKMFTVSVRVDFKPSTNDHSQPVHYSILVDSTLKGIAWEVLHRFKDFEVLHAALQKQRLLPPALPPKHIRRNPEELQARAAGLQGYCDAVLSRPELCSDPVVSSFFDLEKGLWQQVAYAHVSPTDDGQVLDTDRTMYLPDTAMPKLDTPEPGRSEVGMTCPTSNKSGPSRTLWTTPSEGRSGTPSNDQTVSHSPGQTRRRLFVAHDWACLHKIFTAVDRCLATKSAP